MKGARLLAAAAMSAFLMTTTVHAIPQGSAPSGPQSSPAPHHEKLDQKDFKNKHAGMKRFKDPVEMLMYRKEKIKRLLEQGKITKEEADAMYARIEEKIKQLQEFNRLPLQERKNKLINDFKALMEKRLKEGDLTWEKADELLKKYTEQVEKWDGSGFPPLFKKGFRHYKHQGKDK